ncbi:hypothetical protein CKO38_17515 [Rhodospirillum rubrum]|uniref:class I SAM-dependent methyltransferase n=1 Tax=Rhodospirillum rubrum TaxID=1085 RepID=UPI0019068EEB|nr:class I SAM-dependent methyltransferase [Rhodospirillum rubrum]MBK1666171.1 hypothetical protein [Rhodospirillum rubrum]MBK1678431.1 hypothetical protein [Rhodospirillum rubrum]
MDEDDRRVAGLYAQFLAENGPNYRALDWSSPRSQPDRFARLAAVGIASGHSVLDVGCGLGDLLPWIDNVGLAVDYTGLDMTPEMIAHCRATYDHGRFLEGNLLDGVAGFAPRSFDWVVASGIFAHRKEKPWEYMTALIVAMADLAKRGIAFNAQSLSGPNPQTWLLYHADPDETIAFCESLGWSVRLTHDWRKTDFTICMWRPDDEAAAPGA